MTLLHDQRATSAPSPSPLAEPAEVRPGAQAGLRERLRWRYRHHRVSLLYVVPLLALTGLASRIGMGGSPQRIDDEGTYTAQAYAVERLGELTHYTFWYDHPPLGWIQIAGWTWLTDAFDRYDVAVLAGREAMVFAHVVSALLLWVLARRLGLSRPGAAVALGIYALSPLSVQFTRTVYLDNVATPWLLLAFVLAMNNRRQLLAFAGSALAFGIATLTKETYLLLLPFLVWQLWRSADRETRRYTLSVAGSLLTLLLATYAVFALIKGEVFPGDDRVSLVEGIEFQLVNRESSGSVLDAASQAGRSVAVWLTLDPVLAVAGLLAAAVALFVPRLRVVAAALVFLTLVLFKPGYLPVPFVIVMIPFAAVLVAGVLDLGVRRHGRALTALTVAGALALSVAAVPVWGTQLRGLFLADLDRPLREAQSWVSDNVPEDERILVDDAVWVDLVEDGRAREDVVWYYKADTDSAVSVNAPNGWRDYDWVLVTQALRRSLATAPTVADALDNGTRTAVFGSGDGQVEVFRVNDAARAAFAEAELRDEQARTDAGRALLANPDLTVSPEARAQLRQGGVDSRVVSLLALLAADHRLTVTGFPAVFGEDGQLPRRTVEVSEVDGRPVTQAPGAAVAKAAREQLGTYRPEMVNVPVQGSGTDGRALLLMRYDVTGPEDLIPAPAGS